MQCQCRSNFEQSRPCFGRGMGGRAIIEVGACKINGDARVIIRYDNAYSESVFEDEVIMSTPEIYIDPARPKLRMRPLKALGHMNKLFADKEDTAQVFHIIEALNGNALERNLRRSLEGREGRARFGQRRSLAPLLDDHEAFGALPIGSVGQAYIDFMKREGLTAAGLVAESDIRNGDGRIFDDDLTWFGNRLRDTHDMYHVLSGYGRDSLGEAALLAFSYEQQPGRGIIFISFMAFRRMRKMLPASLDLKTVWHEARENGRAAARIMDQDILALLNEPLAEARARLNIKPPTAYKAALRAYDALPLETREMFSA